MSSGGDGGDGGSSAARYERQEQIGSGTFGHAWLVRSRASGRHYVVKEIKVTALPEQEREQSVNEVAILSQCKHVNIIRYKEAFIDQLTGSLNIVMEYADGGDLYARIVNQRATNDHFPEELILNWFIQITFAVQYLHSKNILHRDLKTQNIFLTSENLVKVGDFGIARTLRSTQELATTAIGTPYYLSPEICQRQPYNHKSDQWAVGCIIYEMCCLTHPFNASSFENLVLKILQARYSPIPSHYSLLLRDLVTVLLRTQPERRPSAEQVLMIPALKPYVDSYVQWQNAAMSPRGSHRGTTDSAQGSSNGSDDRDSLTSSQEDISVSSMTVDSLETAAATDQPAVVSEAPSVPAASPTPAPPPASAPSGAARAPAQAAESQPGRRAPHAWRSQYANQLEDEADWDGREKRSPPVAPAVARRRSEDAGSPTEVPVAVAPRQRSSSLSSLSPESRGRPGRDGEREHTPGTKLKGRGQVSRGPSALIRQVLKNKFSRQEPMRPRSASDPAEPSEPSEPRSCPRRDRSPARVFRRPSLSVARGGTPRSPRPHSAAGRSRSPVQQSRSPVAGSSSRGGGKASPPLATRNARFLEAPTPRSSGASIVRPVERRTVSRCDSTISATSNMSTNSSVTTSTSEQPSHAGAAAGSPADPSIHSGSVPRNPRETGTPADDSEPTEPASRKQQQQPARRSDSSASDAGVSSSQQRASSGRRLSAELQQQRGSGRPESPVSWMERQSAHQQQPNEADDTDSDSQEATLVNMPVSRLPDVNHNSIQIPGGQLHGRSAECAGGRCCSLICAQCRYAKDEQLARLMWSARLRNGPAPDDTTLTQHLAKLLGAERLNAMLALLLAGWESGAGSGWSEELLLALGREQLHLLPLLVQVLQLRSAAGRTAASPGHSGHRPTARPGHGLHPPPDSH